MNSSDHWRGSSWSFDAVLTFTQQNLLPRYSGPVVLEVTSQQLQHEFTRLLPAADNDLRQLAAQWAVGE
jgi:hypothetical protein